MCVCVFCACVCQIPTLQKAPNLLRAQPLFCAAPFHLAALALRCAGQLGPPHNSVTEGRHGGALVGRKTAKFKQPDTSMRWNDWALVSFALCSCLMLWLYWRVSLCSNWLLQAPAPAQTPAPAKQTTPPPSALRTLRPFVNVCSQQWPDAQHSPIGKQQHQHSAHLRRFMSIMQRSICKRALRTLSTIVITFSDSPKAV